MTDFSNHIQITSNKVQVSGLNHVYIIPQENGDVTIIGGQYKPAKYSDIRNAIHGNGPALVNDRQAKLVDTFSKTITPEEGQTLSVQGIKGQVDNIRLQNKNGYNIGFDSIEIDGQGGGSYGSKSTNGKNAGDNVILDLTDDTPVTVHSHDEGYQGWDRTPTRDVISITSSDSDGELKIVPKDQVKIGFFSSRTIALKPLLTNKAEGPRTLDEMSREITTPSVTNYIQVNHEDGSYTLNFED